MLLADVVHTLLHFKEEIVDVVVAGVLHVLDDLDLVRKFLALEFLHLIPDVLRFVHLTHLKAGDVRKTIHVLTMENHDDREEDREIKQ